MKTTILLLILLGTAPLWAPMLVVLVSWDIARALNKIFGEIL